MSTVQAAQPSGRAVFQGALQGTALYSIPLIGQRVASIFLLSIVTRVLTRDDFGMLSLLEQVSSILNLLLCGSFSAALGYFYFRKDAERERDQVVGTAIAGSFALGALACVVCWPAMGVIGRDVFGGGAALLYLPLVFLNMPFDFGNEAFFTWLRVEDRQAAFARISVLRIALMVGGIGVLVGILKMHVGGYLATTLGAQVVFARMFRFSLPLGFSLIAMFVINFGDQFILRRYRSLAEVGIYALAYRIGLGVSLAYNSFHAYWTAQVYQILQRDDADGVFARLLTYAALLVSVATRGCASWWRPGSGRLRR